MGLGLDSKAWFDHKRNQAENELFAFTCLNATQGIFERTFVILTDGLDMMCLTYQVPLLSLSACIGSALFDFQLCVQVTLLIQLISAPLYRTITSQAAPEWRTSQARR